MKRRIFLVSLYCFFRLPIYESIKAIFWQSASYVFSSKNDICRFFSAMSYLIKTVIEKYKNARLHM